MGKPGDHQRSRQSAQVLGERKNNRFWITKEETEEVTSWREEPTEMLRRGTTVLLCANSRPILNDVTYAELSYILGQV